MEILGGYGSDSSNESDQDAQAPAPKKPKVAKPEEKSSSNGKRVINFSKLPVSRPLLIDDKDGKAEEEAPLRKAAEAENLRLQAGRSLLAALPAPKVTLGVESDQLGSGSRIDLSEIKLRPSGDKQTEVGKDLFHNIGSIMRGTSAPEIAESGEVPQHVMNHPMFRNDATAGAGGATPSAEEIHQMKANGMKFLSVTQDQVQDPDWFIHNQMSGGPGLHKGKSVAEEVSMYEGETWKKTTHANPSKNQKKKHQINWLAHEAMEKEAEMLDRAASSRLTKAQTSMKYGW